MTYYNPVIIDTPDDDLLERFMGPHVHVARYVDIYEPDNNTLWRGQVPVTEGSVSVDMGRAERRNMQFTFFDGDGELGYGPNNGLWYDKIVKPYRGIVVPEDNFVTSGKIQFPNVNGNTISTPNVPALRVTGDMSLKFGIESQDWSQDLQTVFGFSWTPGTLCYLRTSGAQNYFTFYWYDTTTGLQRSISTPLFDRPAAGDVLWVWLVLDLDNGAGGSTLYSYTSLSPFGGWVDLAPVNNGATPTTAQSYGTTAPLVIGGWHATAGSNPFNGFIHYFNLRAGANATFEPDGGTNVFLYHADRDLRDVDEGAATFTTYWTGHVMTVNRTAAGTKQTRIIPSFWANERAYVSPLGEFMIDTIERPHHPALMTVNGRDFAKKLRQAKFTATTTFVASTLSIEDLIETIATNAGIEKFKLAATGKTLTSNITFERDSERWEAIYKLAESVAHEVYFDRFGYMVLRPYINPLTLSPSYHFGTGMSQYETIENHVKYTNVGGNYLYAAAGGVGTDPSVEARVEATRPLSIISPASVHRVASFPSYIGFTATTISANLYTTVPDAPAVSATISTLTGFPAPGEKVQLKWDWNATTDTLSLWWRLATVELDDNTLTWNLAVSVTGGIFAGKVMNTITTWPLGGTAYSDVSQGKGYRWMRWVNGVLTFDCNLAKDMPANAQAASFTCTTGQLITVVRSPRIEKITFPGATGNYLSTADAAAIDVLGDLTIIAELQPTSWTSGINQMVVSKWTSVGQQSYRFYLDNTGTLRLEWSNDGTAVNAASSVAHGFGAGVRRWIAVTLDVDNGAAGRTIRFWTSSTLTTDVTLVSWTQLGTDIVQAGTTSIFNSTSTLTTAANNAGTGNFYGGDLFHVAVRTGIGAAGIVGGTDVYRVDRRASASAGVGSTSFLSSTGVTVTVNRSGGSQTALTLEVPPDTLELIAASTNEIVLGSAGNLVRYNRRTDDSRMYNEVPVRGSGQTNGLVFGRAENNEPLSPTSIDNIGRRTMPPIENPIVATNAEANLIAQKILNVAGLESYDVSMDSLVAPWLESGDAVTFIPTEGVADEPTQFLLTGFTIPFTLSPMSCTAKRVWTQPPIAGTYGYGTYGGGTYATPA